MRIPLRAHKVFALPERCEPNALYFVREQETVELYVTSIDGTPSLVWSGARVAAAINAALQDLGLTFHWTDIPDRPTSSPAEIDAAVAVAHSHTNAAVLNALGELAGGTLTFRGQQVNSAIDNLDGGHF